MQYLFESWCAAGEDWKSSTVYINVTSRSGSVRRGVKRWMCRSEIARLLGDDVCAAIIEHKYSIKHLRDTEIRDHPDAPGCEARYTS